MKNSEKGKFQILIVLIGLLGLSFFWNRPEFHQPVFHASEPRSNPVVSSNTDEVPQLELLNKPPSGLQVKRDIFRFRDEEVASPTTESLSSISLNPKPEASPAPEIPDVRYLGFYKEKKPSKVKLAAISNGGKIYVGGVGDVLADKYEVVRVDDDFVVLKILADNRVLRFSLGNVSGKATVLDPGN